MLQIPSSYPNYPISRMNRLQKLQLKKGQTSEKVNHHLVQTRRKKTRKQNNPLQNRLTSPPFQNLVQKKCDFWNIWNKFVIICHIHHIHIISIKFELVAKKKTSCRVHPNFLGGKFVSDLTSARLHPNPKDDW